MRSLLLIAALLLAAPAHAWELRSDSPVILDARELYRTERFDAVIMRLPLGAIDRLPRRNRAEAYRLLGGAYENLGLGREALSVYRLAEGLYPKDIALLTALADLLHHNDLDEQARPFYERVLKIHPNNASSNLGMAEILRVQGLTLRAQRHYEKALTDRPSDPSIWRGYAEVLGQRRDFKAASRALRNALKISEDGPALCTLAIFQRSAGEPEAYETLRKASLKEPARMDYRLRGALWLLEDGRIQESFHQTDLLLKERPGDPLALWIRANALLRRGKKEEARKDLLLAAQAERTAPFVARVSLSMLGQLESR
jgi:tetratricopeptide (TPR) repeat protein